LQLHPEWNGDWAMPANVRKAEIDTRNGKLIRELTGAEADAVKVEQKIAKTNTNSNDSTSELPADESETEPKEIYVTDVPAEFRRVELFVGGTVPNKALLPTDEESLIENQIYAPTPSETPFETWQEEQQNTNQTTAPPAKKTDADLQMNITVMICQLTGMRATTNCPNKQPKTFPRRRAAGRFLPVPRQTAEVMAKIICGRNQFIAEPKGWVMMKQLHHHPAHLFFIINY